MNYADAISFLDSLQSTKIKLGLERIEDACRRLGHPEKKFKSILVAGTNGKGSTSAFLESILRTEGFKTALYTSPHLNDVRERIQINRKMIGEKDLAHNAEAVRSSLDDPIELTYFEFLTALAFRYFAEENVDIAVLEVGLGGRFDSTNVVMPEVSVITRIGMDHMGYLGDTIEKIAFEKAGIIKEGIPVVTVDQEPKVMEVLREVANEKKCMLHVVSPFDVKYKLGLLGKHQYENAALALRAAELFDSILAKGSETVISTALASTKWPGRLEVVSEEPLVILDGAHNPNGAETLAKFMGSELKDKKKILILGIMADKDIEGILTPLAKVADEVILTRPKGPRAASPEQLLSHLSTTFPPHLVRSIEPLSRAIEEVTKSMPKNSVLIIAGSLYTVGEARDIILG